MVMPVTTMTDNNNNINNSNRIVIIMMMTIVASINNNDNVTMTLVISPAANLKTCSKGYRERACHEKVAAMLAHEGKKNSCRKFSCFRLKHSSVVFGAVAPPSESSML